MRLGSELRSWGKRSLACMISLSLLMTIWVIGEQKNVNAFSDPSTMTDEQFFGVWNDATSSWTVTGKINYSYSSELGAVEQKVKQGNYMGASAALKQYYVNRTSRTVLPILLSNRNPEYANLSADFIFNNSGFGESYLGDLVIEDTPGEFSMNVSKGIEQAYLLGSVSYMLMGRDKQNALASFHSKEYGMNPPRLEVSVNGVTEVLTVVKDTYIRPDIYGNTNYGSESALEVIDQGYPFNDDSRRVYVQFDLSGLSAAPESAVLKLYGSNEAGKGDKRLAVFQSGDTAWGEGALTWNTSKSQTFSWQGNSAGSDWNQPASGADVEWMWLAARFPFARDMTAEYLATSNEFYAERLLTIMLDFIADKGATGGYPRTIDTGLRAFEWLRTYHYMVPSDAMDADANKAVLKYIWQMADFLHQPGSFTPTTNWGLIETRGLYFLAVYFPEFHQAAQWTATANERLNGMVTNLKYEDGSYNEPSSMYTGVGLTTLIDVKKYGTMNGQPFSPIFDQAVEAISEYFMDLALPDGTDVQYGDSDYPYSHQSLLQNAGTLFGRADFTYVGTAGEQGSAPSHASRLYPVKKEAFMRTGWEEDDLYLFINNGSGSRSHTHPDNLAIAAYGYGNRLLVDPGRYTYNASPIADWLRKSTEAHNTIEINDLPQKQADGTIDNWSVNDRFDFFEGSYDTANPKLTVSRSVLFLKPHFWIVSDAVKGSTGSTKYQQTWHTLPDAHLVMDPVSKAASTHFESGGNLQIVPADPGNLAASLDNGYYSPGYLIAADAPYVSYIKQTAEDAAFDTVLYPTAESVSEEVTVERLPLTVAGANMEPAEATALMIGIADGKDWKRYYYLSHMERLAATAVYGAYSFNGKVAYTEEDENDVPRFAAVKHGTLLERSGIALVDSSLPIEDLAVAWNGTHVELSSAGDIVPDTSHIDRSIAIYAPDTTSVSLNGEAIPYVRAGNYIYAVRQLETRDALLADDFDGYAIGGPPIGWSIIADTGTEIKMAGAQNRYVHLSDSNTSGKAVLKKGFIPQRGVVTASWRYMEGGSAGRWPSFSLMNGNTRVTQLFSAEGSNLIYRDYLGKDHVLQGIRPNIWYNIEVKANIFRNTYDIYVDGILMASNIRFLNSASVIDGIEISTGFVSGGSLAIDDVRLSGNSLVNSSFDAEPTGGLPVNWMTEIGGGTSIEIAEEAGSVNRSIKMTDTNLSSKAVLTRRFSPQKESVTAEWMFKENETGRWPAFALVNGNVRATELFAAGGIGLVYRDQAGTDHLVQTIASNQWYRIRITANIAARTYNIYVDDVLKVTAAPFRTNVSSIDGIEFSTGNAFSTTGLYIDEVKIGGASLLNESFDDTPVNAAPSGWHVIAAPGTSSSVSAFPSTVNRSLRLKDDFSSGNVTVRKTFGKVKNTASVEWKFNEAIAPRWSVFTLLNDNAIVAELAVVNGPNLVYRDVNGIEHVVQGVSSNTWYTIRMVVDIEANTYDLYVNGILKVSKIPFINKVNAVNVLEFRTGYGPLSTLYIDDVKVTQ